MFFHLLKDTFSWLPTSLYVLTSAIFTVFAVMILIEVIKLIFQIISFLKDVLGGVLTKVVDFFV